MLNLYSHYGFVPIIKELLRVERCIEADHKYTACTASPMT